MIFKVFIFLSRINHLQKRNAHLKCLKIPICDIDKWFIDISLFLCLRTFMDKARFGFSLLKVIKTYFYSKFKTRILSKSLVLMSHDWLYTVFTMFIKSATYGIKKRAMHVCSLWHTCWKKNHLPFISSVNYYSTVI